MSGRKTSAPHPRIRRPAVRLPLGFLKPIWTPATGVVVAASGPSLTAAQLELCREAGLEALVVNNAYQLAPWARALYAADSAWWNHYQPVFDGDKWICRADRAVHANRLVDRTVERHGLKTALIKTGAAGWSHDWLCGGTAGHSGYQAVQLAWHLGARDIILLGYDCRNGDDGKRHFFGDHEGKLNKRSALRHWGPMYAGLKDLPETVIVNATPDSAIDAFPKMTVLEALREREARKYQRVYALEPNYRMGPKRKAEAFKAIHAYCAEGSLLDVGCGCGEVLQEALRRGMFPVFGLEGNLDLCQSPIITHGTALDLPWGSQTIDWVTCFDVLEHLLPCDTTRALKELWRVARVGVILTVNNLPSVSRVTKDVLHINRRPYDEWAEIIASIMGPNVKRSTGYSETFIALR